MPENSGSIQHIDDLRAFIGAPMKEVEGKEMPALDDHAREFVRAMST